MSQPIFGLAPAPPFWSCCVYSTLTFAKLSVTFSVSRSSPPDPPVETDATRMSSSLMIRYSSAFSPALRTVNCAFAMCLPLQLDSMRSGVATSMYLVSDRSCTFTLPEPAPPPRGADPELLMPQLHARTAISSLCLLSTDSPLMPSSFRNMSTAMGRLLLAPYRVIVRPSFPRFNFVLLDSRYFPPLADGSFDTSRS